MVLFSEPASPRDGALGWTEPAVHWLTDITRPEAVEARHVVNEWYADFPDPGGRLAATLRSEEDYKHYQALDELYVHSQLRSVHDDIRYEEEPGAPDFRVYENGICIAGIEVASLFEQDEWTKEGAPHRRLADAVNKRLKPSDGYMVYMDIETADRDPAPRRFSDWLAKQIASLPPTDQLHLPPNATRDVLESRVFVDGGVRVRVWFVPMKPNAPGRTDPNARLIVSSAAVGGIVRAASRLRDRVQAKSGGRYKASGEPFLVVVGNHDVTCDDDDIESALFGSESVNGYGPLTRTRDGIFGMDGSGRPKNQRLSAVAVVSFLRVWRPVDTDVALLRNPYPAVSWPDHVLPISREYGQLSRTETSTQWGWL